MALTYYPLAFTYYVRRLPDGSIRYTRPVDYTWEEQLLRRVFGEPILTGPIPDPMYCWHCGAGPNMYCIHDPNPDSPR